VLQQEAQLFEEFKLLRMSGLDRNGHESESVRDRAQIGLAETGLANPHPNNSSRPIDHL
jgi:hypothetical protein